jgi:hypothetical protein
MRDVADIRILRLRTTRRIEEDVRKTEPRREGAFGFQAGQWVDFFAPGVDKIGGFTITSAPLATPGLAEVRSPPWLRRDRELTNMLCTARRGADASRRVRLGGAQGKLAAGAVDTQQRVRREPPRAQTPRVERAERRVSSVDAVHAGQSSRRRRARLRAYSARARAGRGGARARGRRLHAREARAARGMRPRRPQVPGFPAASPQSAASWAVP